MSRKIYCEQCDAYLGEVRDATLRKDALYICASCLIRLRPAPRKPDTSEDFGNVFEALFSGRMPKNS